MEGSSGGTGPTFYETLDVEEGASTAEIRAAYRERVKDTHPDLNDAPDASRQFQRVKHAHEVLGDVHERRRYDRLGHEAYVAAGEVVPPSGGGTSAGDRSGGDSPRGTHDPETREREGHGSRTGGDRSDDGRASSDRSGSDWSDRRDGPRAGGRTATTDRSARSRTTNSGKSTEPVDSTETVESTRAVGLVAYGLARWLRFAGGLVDAWQGRLGSAGAAIALATFASYPILLVSTVTPLLPLPVNLLVGMCTLALLGYLVVRPAIGVAVLGSWLLILPIALTISGVGVLSLAGLYALLLTGVPFVFCVSTLAGAAA